jgi:hypothetical protein
MLKMKLNCLKVLLIGATLLLGACSSATTHPCYSDKCRLGGGVSNLNLNGNSALGNSFNEYGSNLLHD